MDLYVLDTDLETVDIVDTYKSLIWTDRYQECGDFEICMAMSPKVAALMKPDYYIWRKDSPHLMIIESISIAGSEDEGDVATITGRSLESILDRRVIWGLKVLKGNLQDAIETLLNECIISPSKPERKISNFIFEASDDPYVTMHEIEGQYTGDNLYEVITNLCAERGIGFQITLNDSKQFVFRLYSGTDRSYDQITYPSVIFSNEFNNLVDSTYTESKSELKNVTLVGGEGEGDQRRYTAVGNTAGLARRELFTDARDISSDTDLDFSEDFNFSQYTSQVYSTSSNSFVSNSLFNSCMIDVSAYAGRVISLTIPRYNNASAAAPQMATILVDASKNYISTLKVWEKYDAESVNKGDLQTYEITLPTTARYMYTSMFSQAAITQGVYGGELADFKCMSIKLSSTEYIALLRQRGSEKLSENTEVVSFEGKAETTMSFQYGRDFFIGDVVQVADNYGHETTARVIEYILSEDESGIAAYPTFSTMAYERPEETGTLPEDYRQIPYIESTGTQYIDTGFQPDQNTRIVMEVQVTEQDTSTICIFGARNEAIASATLACVLWSMNNGTTIRSDYFGDNKTVSFDMPGRLVRVDKNGHICMVNNVVLTNELDLGHSALSLYLLTCNNAGSVNSAYNTKAKLYACKIYDKGTLVRDFVPVEDIGGAIGMFDLIGQTFYGNAGTGVFIPGKE